jgi:SAM-dependent MidA family methyltransferase
VVEQGGNDGAFACDVCNGLRNDFPEVYSALRYVLVEPFEALRAAQSHALGDHLARISWVPTLEALPRFSGIHFSNEYADALPVRLFIRQDAQWLERHVDTSDSGDLVWKDLAIQGENLEKIAANLPAEAPPGRIAEWRPLSESWIGDVSEKVERGLILISDYGFPRSDLHAPWRSEGTLSCYTRHRRDADPLVDVGDKDITAHVDFTALARAATSAGCGLAGFTDQHHFLIGLAESWLQQPNLLTAKERNAFRALMHPEMMGTQFKYLGLTKGMDLQNPLAGFRHAGNGIHRVLDQHGDDDASDA